MPYSTSTFGGGGTTATVTVRTGLRVERELKRVIEAYKELTKDAKWNPKVISLALKIIKFHVPSVSMSNSAQLSDKLI